MVLRRIKSSCLRREGAVLVFVCAVVAMLLNGGTVWAAKSGSIVGWGLQVVGGDLSSGFTQIAAGGEHSLGLKGDGSIVAWGRNDYGQCNGPSPNSGFVAVAAVDYHSLGIRASPSAAAHWLLYE